MSRYAVLLRGVNVGRAKRIAMADLRALLTDLGYRDVRTHLNSGNAVLTGPEVAPEELAARVRQELADRRGLEVGCLAVTAPALRAVVEGLPWPDRAAEGSRLLAHFLSAAPDPQVLAAHDPEALDPERIVLGDRVIYQWCPDGVLAAPQPGAALERHGGITVTARNWNTVVRLDTLLR